MFFPSRPYGECSRYVLSYSSPPRPIGVHNEWQHFVQLKWSQAYISRPDLSSSIRWSIMYTERGSSTSTGFPTCSCLTVKLLFLLWAFENCPSISNKKTRIKFGWWICLGFKQQMLYPSGVTAVRVEEQCGPSSLPSPASLCLWRFRWGRIKNSSCSECACCNSLYFPTWYQTHGVEHTDTQRERYDSGYFKATTWCSQTVESSSSS